MSCRGLHVDTYICVFVIVVVEVLSFFTMGNFMYLFSSSVCSGITIGLDGSDDDSTYDGKILG